MVLTPEGDHEAALITLSGHVREEDGIFPAISANHQQIAILHIEDPHDPSAFLTIFNAVDRSICKQFNLVLADDRNQALNSIERDAAVVALEGKIEDNIAAANRYLSENAFYSVPELYNIRHRFAYGFFSADGNEQNRVWEGGSQTLRVNYNHDSELLRITSIENGDSELHIRQPILVYGQSNPGALCRARPVPYQGWYDEESDFLIIRLALLSGMHGCDVPDRWMITRLKSR